MTATTPRTASWRKLWNLSSVASVFSSNKRDPDEDITSIPERSPTRPIASTPNGPLDNASSSPFLRLPAELRNQIYSYLDFSICKVEVLSLAKNEYHALDANGQRLHHNPYSDNRLWFRLEQDSEQEFNLDRIGKEPPRKRSGAVQALFALPHVCRQVRAETLLLCYESTFTFSDFRYNYSKAFPAFVKSLSPREKAAVRSIRWPLRQAREYHYSRSSRRPMLAPDKAFREEFRSLANLERVTLLYVATDVGDARLLEGDREEFQQLLEETEEDKYIVDRTFRRELAIRGMRKQVYDGREVEIQCERLRTGWH